MRDGVGFFQPEGLRFDSPGWNPGTGKRKGIRTLKGCHAFRTGQCSTPSGSGVAGGGRVDPARCLSVRPARRPLADECDPFRVEDGEDEEAKPSEATIVVEFHIDIAASIVVGCDHRKASTLSRWHVMS